MAPRRLTHSRLAPPGQLRHILAWQSHRRWASPKRQVSAWAHQARCTNGSIVSGIPRRLHGLFGQPYCVEQAALLPALMSDKDVNFLGIFVQNNKYHAFSKHTNYNT
jgi:hypothetical protein